MKFAIIRTGGKQYLIQEGSKLSIERLANEDADINFEDVLLTGEGEKIQLGAPQVVGSKITGTREGNVRGKKVTTLKYKPKARTRVKGSSRQTKTKVTITTIA